MKRLILLGAALVAMVAMVAVIVGEGGGATPAHATGTGPNISVGTPSLVSGHVEVPINAGSSTDPFGGFNIHLSWDSAIFSFDAADTNDTGDIVPGTFCTTDAVTDPNGVIFACTSLTSSTTSGPGLLGTIALTVEGAGCSDLHLFTFGAPDGGDNGTGTYTVNLDDFSAMTNTYTDGGSTEAGVSCSAGGPTPTATNTPTETAVPSNTPGGPTDTPTNTPIPGTNTATPFGGLRTITPSPTPPVTDTPGPAPTEPPSTGGGGDTGNGGAPGGTGSGPGGAPGGTINLPDTGSGSMSGSGSLWLAVISMAAAFGLLTAGAGYAVRRTRR